jgi:predicted transcriptional regulator of viral defense system
MTKQTQSIDDKILRSIRASSSASVFTTKGFMRFGKGPAIGQALARLVKAGRLRRVRHGLYDLPRSHPILDQTPTDPTAMVQALMKDNGAQWQFSGAYAANLLGLSEQVPAQIVVFTDGTPRRVALGKLIIVFRHAAPRNLLGAGRPAGMVIQALKYMKRAGLTPTAVDQLRRRLDAVTKADLATLTPDMPVWMQPLINRIVADTGKP